MVAVAPTLAASLSTGHKLGLILVALAFVAFALMSSFVLPARNPDFPGKKGMPIFATITVGFFVAMIAAVVVFGRESSSAETAPATTSAPAATTTAPGATTTTGGGPAVQGDPVAGKAVFASAGCVGCHTLKAANATGTVGPNLDQLKPPYARIVLQVENGGAIMPPFKGRLSAKQIQDVAAFVYASTH